MMSSAHIPLGIACLHLSWTWQMWFCHWPECLIRDFDPWFYSCSNNKGDFYGQLHV